MKYAMRTVCPVFNAYRMVKEYTERLYLPAGARWDRMAGNHLERARALTAWMAKVKSSWTSVRVGSVTTDRVTPLEAGSTRPVQAEIALGSLQPADVSVVLYTGPLGADGDITSATASEMKAEGTPRPGLFLYSGTLQGQGTGHHGFRVRILPAHEDLANPLAMNCVAWG
jgi:starch phosphorylase